MGKACRPADRWRREPRLRAPASGSMASAASASSAAFFWLSSSSATRCHQFMRLVELRIDFERFFRGFVGFGIETVRIDFGQPEVRLSVLGSSCERFLEKLDCIVRVIALEEEFAPANLVVRVFRVCVDQALKGVVALPRSRGRARATRLRGRVCADAATDAESNSSDRRNRLPRD